MLFWRQHIRKRWPMERRSQADPLRPLREACLVARQAGQRDWIEHCLAACPDTPRKAALLDLLRAELQCRLDAGERPSREEYLRRFPNDTEVVHTAFLSEEPTQANGPDLFEC